MVNTFLVHVNYRESAQLLDQRRLPNQRREALQILQNVQRLKAMGDFLGQPLPSNPYGWYEWIRQIIRHYRQQTLHLVRLENRWIAVSDPQLLLLGTQDLLIRFGFMYHPAVLMWLGYEESLKEYLDAHIEASIARGVNNQMERYSVRDAPRPAWTLDSDFLNRHRAMLLKKELDRKETPWYQLIPNFVESLVPCRYYWPYTPCIGTSAQIQGEADCSRRYQGEMIPLEVKPTRPKIQIKVKTKPHKI